MWNVDRLAGQLRIYYGGEASWPQYGALHLGDGYFRLNCGPGSGWGTSVIVVPTFWSRRRLRQGAPLTVTWRTEGPELVVSAAAIIAGLVIASDIRLSPPTSSSMIARITMRAAGRVPLDDRPGEAFKPVTLSSMHIAPALWDAQTAYAGRHDFTLAHSGWISQPPVVAGTFGLRGGTSAWKANAPSIEVALDRPLPISGWVTPSDDPNDDNVALWAAADAILPTWRYTLHAYYPTDLARASVTHSGRIGDTPALRGLGQDLPGV
jgi:hypothetical protein